MIDAIIIEDELNSQELLQSILEAHSHKIKVVGIADGVKSGIDMIKKLKPQLIFLDVEIQGGTGFDLLDAFVEPSFKVIFVTGYDHYAIKAIKNAALDYILKPINLDEMNQAIIKVYTDDAIQNKRLDYLKKNVSKDPKKLEEFVLSHDREHNIVKFKEILYVKADRTYITFHMKDDKKHITSNPLHYYETILPASLFFRIHKSYLVNIGEVAKVHAGRGGMVELVQGIVLPVAYRRKAAFLRILKESRTD